MMVDMTRNVEIAFDGIKTAATILGAFPYAEAVDSLRRQEETAYITNPSMMMQAGAKEDIDRKIRLLRAAAAFVAEWNAVKEEALAETSSNCEGQNDET